MGRPGHTSPRDARWTQTTLAHFGAMQDNLVLSMLARSPSLRTRFIGLALISLCACGDGPADISDGGATDGGSIDDATPPATLKLAVVRFENYPSGGREITLRVEDSNGDVPADVSASIDVRWADDTSADFAAAPVALGPGFTAILVRGSADAVAQADIVAALEAFAQLRPAGERLAIYRWGAGVEQLANFTADRARFDLLADRFGGLGVDAAPMNTDDALRTVADEVRDIGGVAPRVMRAVAVIGADTATRDSVADQVLTTVPIVWIPIDAASPEIARDDASARIDELAADAHYAITLCGPTELGTATVSAGDPAGEITVPLPATLPEQTAGTCSLADLGDGKRAYTPVIDFVFTADQRLVFDQRVAGINLEDFDLSVRLGAGEDLVVATAHLHGQGSLYCERKSYTVNLAGPLVRYLLPESAVNEFHLISMCSDNRYIELHTANQISQTLGVYPLKFRYVEVRLDGVTSGVYLLVEKTLEELRRDNSAARSVLRRRIAPPDDYVEVKWARNGDNQAAIDAMDGFITEISALSGTQLEAAMEARIDVDQYLTFIAAQTIWHNGDYVDEAFYVSTDTLDATGTAGDFYETMGWDADDLFSDCHYGGNYAFVDPNQIAYCAEAAIDLVILGDALMYGRYVDKVEELLLTRLTIADFSAALETTRADILPWFARADICAAMVRLLQENPGAIDPAVAQADISWSIDNLDNAFASRHALLLARIAAYRAN